MVRPGPASQTGRKRESSDLELEDNSDMKKPKVVPDADAPASQGNPAGSTEELKTRIKKYLEENRSLKFIDIDEMSKNLHEAYPEYRRRKLNVFKGQVDGAFKTLTEALAKKNALKKNKKQKKIEKNGNGKQVEEIRLEDETTVKGNSMNSRMSSLYSSGNKNSEDSKNNTVSESSHINIDDNDDCEVIEDDVPAEVAAVPCNGSVGSSGDSVANKSIEKEPLTDFERTQLKVKEMSSLQKESTASSTPRPRAPSKNLSAYINSSLGTSPKVVEIERSISEKIDNAVEVTNNFQSLPAPVPSRQNGSGTRSEATPPPQVQPKRPATPQSKSLSKVAPKTPKQPAAISEIDLEEEIANRLTEKHSGKRTMETPGIKKRKKLEVTVQASQVTFAEFGGNEDVLCNICKLLVHLKHPEVYIKLGVTPPRGFLLHGPPGCGKTLLAHAIAGELQLPFIKISAPEIVSGVSGESEQKLRELFDQAITSSPCVLFIDEIDSITPKRENAQREMERRIVAQLLTCLDELSSKPDTQVVVIGATNRPDSLDPALRRAGRFDREIALGIPDTKARRKILEVVCKDLRLEPGTDFGNLALLTPGYVGADLTSLTREAAMAAVNRVFGDFCPQAGTDLASLLGWLRDTPPLGDSQLGGLFIQKDDWKEALKIVQPSAKREGFATVPDVTWGDVGALENVREELQLAILAPVTHQDQFSSLGLPQSSGVLLVGPPGCGKTLVAKAIANEAGINFISVKGPELLNMYVGESERAVRSVFQRAKNSRPCVIFFDEVDSLCPRRTNSSSDSGSGSRVVNQLLTEMDGVEGRAGVWIMAATNRPDILDPAVLRPGRLDKILYVGFPGPRDRVEILRALTKNGSRPCLGGGVSLELVGEDARCEGFSGADVGNLVREASMNALRESLKRGKSEGGIVVEREHFERAFRVVRPSVGGKDRERYQAMGRKYGVREEVGDEVEIANKDQDSEVVNEILSDNEVEMIEPQIGDEENNISSDKKASSSVDKSQDVEVPKSGVSSAEVQEEESIFDIPAQAVTDTNTATEEVSKEGEIVAIDSGDKVNIEKHKTPDGDLQTNNEDVDNADEFVLETFVSGDDFDLEVNSPKRTAKSSESPVLPSPGTVGDNPPPPPKISIRTPDKLNGEVSKFYSALSAPTPPQPVEIQTPGVELRFLSDMVIRVMDSSMVAEIAGKPGKIVSVRAGGEKATVKVVGLSGARIVPVKEVEPELPEEGDTVKSLVWGSPPDVGEVVSLDDDDNAVVKFKEEQRVIQIDMLCKVEVG